MSTARPAVSARAEARYAFLEALQEGDDVAWVLLHLCEAHARILQPLGDLLDHDDRGSGRRRMLDPDRAPASALPALAENYAGVEPDRLTETQLRAAIRERPRLRRCTRPAFDNAVKRTLTGSRLIRVVEQPELSTATLITRPAETPDPEATRLAAESQTPWWVLLLTAVSDEPVWDEGEAAWDAVPFDVTYTNVTIDDVKSTEV